MWKSVYCWYLNYNKNEWSLVNVSDIATRMNEIGFQKITNVPRSSAPRNLFLFHLNFSVSRQFSVLSMLSASRYLETRKIGMYLNHKERGLSFLLRAKKRISFVVEFKSTHFYSILPRLFLKTYSAFI